MDKYEHTFDTWNKVAALYEQNFMQLDLYNHSYDLFCKELALPHAAILEVGCGPGNICRYMMQHQPQWQWLGTDIAPAMIALAKAHNPAASFQIIDTRKIAEIKLQFNGIVSGFCLPYLSQEDCMQFFKDCRHLLHASGILYLSFVPGNYEASGYKTASTGDQTYFYYHPSATIIRQLESCGFKILHQLSIDYSRKQGEVEKHAVIIAQAIS